MLLGEPCDPSAACWRFLELQPQADPQPCPHPPETPHATPPPPKPEPRPCLPFGGDSGTAHQTPRATPTIRGKADLARLPGWAGLGWGSPNVPCSAGGPWVKPTTPGSGEDSQLLCRSGLKRGPGTLESPACWPCRSATIWAVTASVWIHRVVYPPGHWRVDGRSVHKGAHIPVGAGRQTHSTKEGTCLRAGGWDMFGMRRGGAESGAPGSRDSKQGRC